MMNTHLNTDARQPGAERRFDAVLAGIDFRTYIPGVGLRAARLSLYPIPTLATFSATVRDEVELDKLMQ